MKKIAIASLGLAGMMLSSNVLAGIMVGGMSFSPFIGVDAGVRHLDFDTGYGKEHFRDNYPHTNFYIATEFCTYFGLEIGYEQSYRQDKYSYYDASVNALGFQISDDVVYLSESHVQGWHIDLLGFWPICPKLGTELTGTIGVAWLKGHYDTLPIADSNIIGPNLADSIGWSSGNEAVFRFGIGVKQMLACNFGTRLQIIWENTNKLSASTPVPFRQLFGEPDANYNVHAKSGYVATLGFFFQLG